MTATWHTLLAFTEEQFIDAALLNEQIRDNMEYLKGRPFNKTTVASTSTTNTSFVKMTGSDCVLACTGGNVRLLFVGSQGNNTAGVLGSWDLAIDTVRVGDVTTGLVQIHTPDVNRNDCIVMMWMTQTPPTAGNRTFSVHWKTASNTLQAYGYLFAFEHR